jgi:ribulose-phosphate 3-epimerase
MPAPTRDIKIAPSLLAADLARAGEEAAAVHSAGADLLHVDVMDAHFAPNLTFGPSLVDSLNKVCELPMATHLMVNDPGLFAKPFIEAGSDEIFFHIELDIDHAALADEISRLGARPGIALEMDTPAESIAALAGKIDLALVMTVRCGHTGQNFHPEPVKKIPALREMLGEDADIAVDGGVSSENVAMLAAAGANVFIAGKAIFWADDEADAIGRIRAAAQEA